MSDIDLQEGKILFEGEWLSAEELKKMIQEKMQAEDMKFANLASALEELNKSLENSHAVEVRVVITKDEYEKLKTLGGDNDIDSVRSAIHAFIGEDKKEKSEKKKMVIKCPKCKAPIEVTTDERPLVIECDGCGTSGRLTAQNKWAKLE